MQWWGIARNVWPPREWPWRVAPKGRHRRARRVTVRSILGYAVLSLVGGASLSVAAFGLFLITTGQASFG